jgi:hypothetical protein
VTYQEYDNVFGQALAHSELDGQTAWNLCTAYTQWSYDRSYVGVAWHIWYIQGPGSFWDTYKNANTTWDNGCFNEVIPPYQRFYSALRQETNPSGRQWTDSGIEYSC